VHKTLRCRPIDRLVEELAVMAPLPATPPDTDRRWVLRVPPDPYLRFDICDYSLDPRLVGRSRRGPRQRARALRGRAGQRRARRPARRVIRAALDDHRARTCPHPEDQRAKRRGVRGPVVEVRSLASYDALIA
jgi:hypothetical protein